MSNEANINLTSIRKRTWYEAKFSCLLNNPIVYISYINYCTGKGDWMNANANIDRN